MGLTKCFEAIDVCPYRNQEEFPGTMFSFMNYAPFLITPPRIYPEQAGYLGALWGRRDPNKYGPSSITVLSTMQMCWWPSWDLTWWKFDGQEGHFMERKLGIPGGVVMTIYARYFVEPNGTLWWFGNPYTPGAVSIDPDTFESTGGYISGADFESAWGLGTFGIDRSADRLFIQHQPGRVTIWEISTKTKLSTIYAPNDIRQIVLTHDQHIYLIDGFDWVSIYDYEGHLQGCLKDSTVNPPPPKGTLYGWDHYYKRLLRLRGTAEAVDGASTLRVEGLYPTAQEWDILPPIPLQVPRKGRTIQIVSHLCGEGGEPLGGRRVSFTAGGITPTGTTDTNGDAITPITTSAAGSLPVEVTTV